MLGSAGVPEITDPVRAEEEVELAVPKAIAHGNGPNGMAVVKAAFRALARLDAEHAAVEALVIWRATRRPALGRSRRAPPGPQDRSSA